MFIPTDYSIFVVVVVLLLLLLLFSAILCCWSFSELNFIGTGNYSVLTDASLFSVVFTDWRLKDLFLHCIYGLEAVISEL